MTLERACVDTLVDLINGEGGYNNSTGDERDYAKYRAKGIIAALENANYTVTLAGTIAPSLEWPFPINKVVVKGPSVGSGRVVADVAF